MKFDRRAGAGGEHGCEGPAAQHPSHQPRLPLEEGRLVDEEHVVDELAVEGLSAVLLTQIEGIERSEFADSLEESSVPKALDKVKFDCMVNPLQSAILREAKAAL